MANRRFFVVSALFLTILSCNLPFLPGGGGLSQEEAAQLVLDEVVQADSVEGEMIVFAWPQTLQSGDQLLAFNPPEYSPASQPLQVPDEAWFFWIDDAPGARFAHPSRFVVVDQASGGITVTEEVWWPTLNGEGLWVEREDYWNEDNWLFSTVDWQPANPGISTIHNTQTQNLTIFGKTAMTNPPSPRQQARPGRAIVISGEGYSDSQNEEFATDATAMNQLLTQAGFDTIYLAPLNNAEYHPHSDGTSDLDGISAAFQAAEREMKAGETLFIYVTSHGFVSEEDGQGFAAGFGEVLLELWLNGLNPGVEVILVIDACYSGSFSDTTQNYIDMTITSTNATDPAYFDRDDDNDPNPEDEGGEFTSGFVEGWREILSDANEIQRVNAKATDRGISFWQALAGEAFITAAERDAGLLNSKSFPLLTPGLPSAVATPVPTSVVLEDPQNDGLMCRTGDSLSGATPPEIDIGEVTVTQREDELSFTIEYPRVELVDNAILGSVEFDFEEFLRSDPSSTWFFSGRGNFDLNFENTPDGITTEVYEYTGESWEQIEDAFFDAHIEGNVLHLDVPVDILPELTGSVRFWIGSVTLDFSSCDAAGWDENGQAIGELPSILDELQPLTGNLLFDEGVPVNEIIVPSGDEMIFTSAMEVALGGDPSADFAQHIIENYLAVTVLGIDPEGDAVMCGTQEPGPDAPGYVDITAFAAGITKAGHAAVSVISNYANFEMRLEDHIRDNGLHSNTFLGFPNAVNEITPTAEWQSSQRTDNFNINNKFDLDGYFVTFEGNFVGSEWTSSLVPTQALVEGNITLLPIELLDLPPDSVFYLGSNNFDKENPDDNCFEDTAMFDESEQAAGQIEPLKLAIEDATEQVANEVFLEGLDLGFNYVLPGTIINEEGVDADVWSTAEVFMGLAESIAGSRLGGEFSPDDIDERWALAFEIVNTLTLDPINDVTTCNGGLSTGADSSLDIGNVAIGSVDGGSQLAVAIEFLTGMNPGFDAGDVRVAELWGAGVEIRNPDLDRGPGLLGTNQVFYTTLEDGVRLDVYLEYDDGQWETTQIELDTGDNQPSFGLIEHLFVVEIPGDFLVDGSDIFVTSTLIGYEDDCFQDVVDTRTEVSKESSEGLEFVSPRDYFLGARLRF